MSALANTASTIAWTGEPLESAADSFPGIPGYGYGYEFQRVIGEGAFGRVYLALELALNCQRAVKVFHSRENIDWNRAEGRVLAQLDHPSIIPVHMSGLTDDDRWYISMQFICGSDLSRILLQSRVPHHEVADMVAVIARALQYAHERGVIHRDVKPANILIGTDGRAVLSDFGLAVSADFTRPHDSAEGTPAYMSPEQWRGARVDHRTDIWSLGVVLYESLTGQRPFTGESVTEIRHEILGGDIPSVRDVDPTVPTAFQDICQRCLTKDVDDRLPSAADLADELEALAQN